MLKIVCGTWLEFYKHYLSLLYFVLKANSMSTYYAGLENCQNNLYYERVIENMKLIINTLFSVSSTNKNAGKIFAGPEQKCRRREQSGGHRVKL